MPKTSNLGGKDNPHPVTSGYQDVSGPVAAATLGRPGQISLIQLAYIGARAALVGLAYPRSRPALPAGWLTALIARAGDLVFATSDEEARWRGWRIERRQGGLSRAYRDPAFDRIVQCLPCRGIGTTAAGARCAPCSGTGRLTLDPPSIAQDG